MSPPPATPPHASSAQVIVWLREMGHPRNVAGMARFGINTSGTLGVPIEALRKMASELGIDHALAQKLWASRIHEARILASFIDDPGLVSAAQMDRWVAAIDSWDVCDQVCGLFERTRYAQAKVMTWAKDEREFVKRAAFAVMAGLAVHDKALRDRDFERFFRLIHLAATDDRNFVRKAVNWALRSIGKRNRHLHRRALAVATAVGQVDSKAARWIASDALRELRSKKVMDRLPPGRA